MTEVTLSMAEAEYERAADRAAEARRSMRSVAAREVLRQMPQLRNNNLKAAVESLIKVVDQRHAAELRRALIQLGQEREAIEAVTRQIQEEDGQE